MEISFTEITSNTGDFNKTLDISPDGKVTKTANASIYDAIGRTVTIDHTEVAPYLEDLNTQPSVALTLGITPNSGEFQIVTKENLTGEVGIVARTKEFFKHRNSDGYGLMYFDVDGDWLDSEIEEMLVVLDSVLVDSFIACGDINPTSFMRWTKISSGAGVVVNGQKKCGRHIFFPVRNPKEELIDSIFKYLWLYKRNPDDVQGCFSRVKVSSAGNVTPASIIDKTVGGPEKPIFEANAIVTGCVEMVDIIERKCSYSPGGAIDSEIALSILLELTENFQEKWLAKKKSALHLPHVVISRNEAKEKRRELQKKRGVTLGDRDFNNQWNALMDEDVILSDDYLTMVGGKKVSVYEILTNRHKWIRVGGFVDHIKQNDRNVGMILGDDNHLILHSMNHGGVNYKLLFTAEDFNKWWEDADVMEVKDWAAKYAVQVIQSPSTNISMESAYKDIGKKVNVSGAAIKKIINNFREDFVVTGGIEGNPFEVSKKATHIQVVDHFIAQLGDCKLYGTGMYTWPPGGNIWVKSKAETISGVIGRRYGHVLLNTTIPSNIAITKAIFKSPEKAVDEWHQEYGVPCMDGFYKMSTDGVEKVPYTKELGCRYKLKFTPDPNCPTPNFDKLLSSVMGNKDHDLDGNAVLMQQLFGLTLGGYLNKLQKVAVFFGPGGLGKSAFAEVLRALMPGAKTTSVPLEDLKDPEKIMSLSDSAVNIMDETDGRVVSASAIKRLTGGNRVTGRQLYVGTKEFTLNCQFWLMVNEWPKIKSAHDDMRRRFGDTIVQFIRKEGFQTDLDLVSKIVEYELPGVLSWALIGAESYLLKQELSNKHSLKMWGQWAGEIDVIEAYFRDEWEFIDKKESKVWPLRADVIKGLQGYCTDVGRNCPTKDEFGKYVGLSTKVDKHHTNRGFVIRGIKKLVV